MENQDSLTPTQYGKMVGMFPDPPHNPLPTGGYMDAGFDWVVHQAENFCADCKSAEGCGCGGKRAETFNMEGVAETNFDILNIEYM